MHDIPTFHRNDFSPTFARRAQVNFYARACAHGKHVNGVVSVDMSATIGMYGERKTNARCLCTPPSTVEMFGEEISAEACSSKDIAGLLRKMGMMMNR